MARTRLRTLARLAAVIASVGMVASAAPAATIVIGDFEGALDAGWTSSGNVATRTNAFGVGSTLNNRFLELRTTTGVSTDAALNAFFGFAANTIDGLSPNGNNVTEGSGVRLVLAVNAGDQIQFDYNFLTNENTTDAPTFRDFAFSTIRSGAQGEVVLADVFSMTRQPTSNGGWSQTDWQTASYTFAMAGTYTLGFGVVDVQDTQVDSRLLLDNILLIQTPEPGTGVLVSLGLVALALRRRRERATA